MRNVMFSILALFAQQAMASECSPATGNWYWASGEPGAVESTSVRLALKEDGTAMLNVGATRLTDSGHGEGPIVVSHQFFGSFTQDECVVQMNLMPGSRVVTAQLDGGSLVIKSSSFIQEGLVFERR